MEERPDGYLWTVADQLYEHCPSCDKSRPTYCQVRDDDKEFSDVCCCWCQRILRTIGGKDPKCEVTADGTPLRQLSDGTLVGISEKALESLQRIWASNGFK